MEIFSIDDDCDAYLEHDIIINTIIDNGFNDSDFIFNDKWLLTRSKSIHNTLAHVKLCDISKDTTNHFRDRPFLTQQDLRPVCIKILNADDHSKDLTSYDAEVYMGHDDGNYNSYLTNIDNEHTTDATVTKISTYHILNHPPGSSNLTFPMSECNKPNMDCTRILQIKMNLTQQMDSIANNNVTNDAKMFLE